ncbi:MAG: NPCBM/NEW2 domain-containing protein [Clostridia bacterium]|nr:NPCBM/NEW2 domain-containing protein [Clostridia bacterium]
MYNKKAGMRTVSIILTLAVLFVFIISAVPAYADEPDLSAVDLIPEDVIIVSDLQGITHELIDTPGITDGINQGLVGENPKMIINGIEYEKGFCTHPISASEPSVITVDISKYSSDYPIFHVLAGKDYTTEGGGSGHTVRFEIQADGEMIYTSEILDYGQSEELYVNVNGRSEISIVCYTAGPFAWLTTDFVNAFLCKPEDVTAITPTEEPNVVATTEPDPTNVPGPTEKPEIIFISDISGITHELIDSAGITDGINKGLTGNTKIVLNGKEYEKGFCTHPVSGDQPSEITVNIGEYSSEYPILHMITGKDESTAGGGMGHPILYEVLADGQSIYLSDNLEYGEEEEVYLSVYGAKELTLLCYAGGPFAWLTTDFADAYLCSLEIKEIKFSAEPLKKYYQTGEPLSVNGGELEILYENGYTQRIDISGSMASGFDPDTAGVQEITISYCGSELTYTVTVEQAPEATATALPTDVPSAAKQPESDTEDNKESRPEKGIIIAVICAVVLISAVAAAVIIVKKRKTK